MKWFSASINEAVTTSKSRQAIFVVFVAGTDELSIEATKVIDTAEISSILEKDDFVAIKLESGSDSYRLFAQIYQLVPVPSLFFIGKDGKPLEIVAGNNITVTNLHSKINDILAAKAGEVDAASDSIKSEATNTAAISSQSSTTDDKQEESTELTTTTTGFSKPSISTIEQNPVDTSQVTQILREHTPSTSMEISPSADKIDKTSNLVTDEKNDLTSEEKVERAKTLIELQKEQRLAQEREKEKQREKERRDIGKQMQNARRKQQDLEMKLAHEERKKEKAAELEARERIRAQIEQDKLERKQRERALLQQSAQQQNRDHIAPVAFVGDGNARIQFRLPSGDSHAATFNPANILRELRTYVVNNIDLPFRQFSLSTSFPRRDLNQDDDEKTLLELELVPTAVILILPIRNQKPTSLVPTEDSSFLSRFMWALFAPILTVYNYLSNLLFGTQSTDTNQQNESNTVNDESIRTSGGVYASSSQSNTSQSTGAIRRTLGGANTTVRARGNVHRLHSGRDDNDENNTWNGNSTQQM